MDDVIIWGDGRIAKAFYKWNEELFEEFDINVIAIVDKDPKKWGMHFSGDVSFLVQRPDVVLELEYDYIVAFVSGATFQEFMEELQSEYGIDNHRIKHCFWLLQNKIIQKYDKTKDKEIKETLEYWRSGKPLSVFNQHEPTEHSYSRVYHDETSVFPYIWFETECGNKTKMYFPNDYQSFIKKDDTWYVKDILSEQTEDSPHLYVDHEHYVQKGDIVLDVGVCEGNFALRYVEVASKIYMFESDGKWRGPLQETFRKYGKKVKLIEGRVGDSINNSDVCIDSVMLEEDLHADFIKMDIEGAELAALNGASRVIMASHPKLSVCTYHGKEDAINIRHFLEKLDYRTRFSNGYMLFLCSRDFFKEMDFRHGVIYADYN